MATATTQAEKIDHGPVPSPAFRPYRMTVDVYQRITASGAFGDKSPVFLWDGQLVEKVSDMSKGRPHVFALNRLDRILSGLVPGGYFAEQEQPLELGIDRVPEPDLKVVRGRDEDYRRRDPAPRDVPLVAEVADSSLADDRGVMLRAYAAALVPVYWVVNLPDRRVEVYTDPTGPERDPAYRSRRDFGPDDEVPVVLDGREVGKVAVKDVLP